MHQDILRMNYNNNITGFGLWYLYFSSFVIGLWTRMACSDYEVVRDGTCSLFLKPGFQPRTGANPDLYYG